MRRIFRFWFRISAIFILGSVVVSYVMLNKYASSSKRGSIQNNADIIKEKMVPRVFKKGRINENGNRTVVNNKKQGYYASDETYKEIELREKIASVIKSLQKPRNCNDTRKLICRIKVSCEPSCLLHHILGCLFISLATKRTLILDKSDTRFYATDIGHLGSLLLPISKCEIGNVDLTEWKGEGNKEFTSNKEVALTIKSNEDADKFSFRRHQTNFKPGSVHDDFVPAIYKFYGNPALWWIGQLMKYIFRFWPEFYVSLQRKKKDIGFTKPIVGLNLETTRTSGSFSKSYIKEYMKYVEMWYNLYDQTHMPVAKRRVFVASNQENILQILEKKYSGYVFINDPNHPQKEDKKKSKLRSRLIDIELLSQCNFFVGNFSSETSRLVFELMQTRHRKNNFSMSVNEPYCYKNSGFNFVHHAIKYHESNDKEGAMESGNVVQVLGPAIGYKPDCYYGIGNYDKKHFYPVDKLQAAVRYSHFKSFA